MTTFLLHLCRAGCLYALTACLAIPVQAATWYPQSRDELKDIRDSIQPGDEVILPAGELDWGQIYLPISGAEGAPVVVRAPEVYATTLTGSTFIQVKGSYITIRGFKFVNNTGTYPVWFTDGIHNRVTQCWFEEASASACVRSDYSAASSEDAGSWLVVDHNYFTGTGKSGLTVVSPEDPDYIGEHRIEYNVFRDAPRRAGGAESIVLYANGKHQGFKTNSRVAYNVFDAWDSDVDSEILSIKSGGNLFTRNVFAWCRGYFSLRRENENTIDGNLLYNNTEGFWIYGDGHVIVNNVVHGARLRGLYLPNGWFRSSDGIEAKAATNCLIANNTFFNVLNDVWLFRNALDENPVVPLGNTLANNIIQSEADFSGSLLTDQANFLSNNTVTHNLFYRATSHFNGPTGDNAITASAEIVADGAILHITEGSPAIDAGLASTAPDYDFFAVMRDALPDVGHHEFSVISDPARPADLPPVPPDRSDFDTMPLAAEFTVFPTQRRVGEPVNLDASISKGPIVSMTWDLGDGHVHEGTEAFYPYAWKSAGIKTVTLTVEDADGNTASAVATVEIIGSDEPDPNGWLFTGEWLGWVNVTHEPWWFTLAFEKYVYVPDTSGWIYLPK